MTILDKSIPYYPVLMILPKEHPIREASLAKGYRFVPFNPRYVEDWVHLHVSLGQIASFEEGMRYFAQTFLPYLQDMERQMILVVDEKGELAGTSSIWRGNHFGEERLRVHWVGVSENHQRKGIAKAMMIKTIAMYDALHKKEELYLTTQTNSYVAISMYLSLGFQPYFGEMPVNFHGNCDTFKQDNALAWKLIYNKIKETKGS